MQEKDRKSLSKFMTLILRHRPQDYGVSLDRDGFVPVATLVSALRQSGKWSTVNAVAVRSAVDEVVKQCDKQRFEIAGDKIRARYGHTVEQKVKYPEVEPPDVLFHGTYPGALESIRKVGIQSMSRQYVHLSESKNQADSVGSRHVDRGETPIILTVYAKDAWKAGVKFYGPFRGNSQSFDQSAALYMSDPIPVAFIGADELGSDGDRFSRIASNSI